MNNRIEVGTEIIVKVGCNEVEAIVTKVDDSTVFAKSKRSGKEFKVNSILRVLTPAAPIEAPVPAAPATEKPAKKLSLLKAAFQVLKESGAAMNTKELLAEVQAKGLWQPSEGKTPANTLYAAILRDITTKPAPMFKRSESRKGAFESAR